MNGYLYLAAFSLGMAVGMFVVIAAWFRSSARTFAAWKESSDQTFAAWRQQINDRETRVE
jgi:cytochrome c biogenesis protein CcdA